MKNIALITALALEGLIKRGLKSSAKIDTQPIAPKKEASMVSKRKYKKMKGKKTRKNRGKQRSIIK